MTIRTALLALGAVLAMSGHVHAQATIKLDGRCERLVIADKDLSESCQDTLTNGVARNRASFEFTTKDGRSLSFSGNGAQQERTEETDPLQPINMIIPGEKGADGIVRNPTVAVGACSFKTPEAGKTAIVCEATSAAGRFEGTFVTDAKDASKDAAAPAKN
ncbi:hypothetical protein [Methylobacterium sp. Leaf466]|uniref:hypothetical protein n=1 Tax=Methylobacterium sp. Leaf466 TaxID=1736386 RepID=UPI0006F2DA18|nr:hypothetical protein [Methylobacterium sp. Leaf466]KQT76909.1 hypothetical protein ASG59_13190 [Methylobacterium sp. Leaf466]